MPENLAAITVESKPDYPRTRSRRESLRIDREKIANRIEQLFKDFSTGRNDDLEYRIQRYAKYRQWTSGEGQWDDSSDCALPDMMSGSLRVKDTLHNSVIASRPIISPRAINEDTDKDKEEMITHLIDTQVFVEQPGEEFIGECAEAFVDDGVCTVFVPWVKERRQVQNIKVFGPIPPEALPVEYFEQILGTVYPGLTAQVQEGGWDWSLADPSGEEKPIKVSFYTKDNGRVEMIASHNKKVFDGPRPIVKDYEDVLYPNRCSNLQIPSPSNPGGASSVILVDYPTIDEIIRLKQEGFYDLLTQEDVDKLLGTPVTKDPALEPSKQAKDDFQGESSGENRNFQDDERNKTVTRLLVFDIYDINGDGIGEDVMWWMILEEKIVMRAKYLVEMYPPLPGQKPLRPLAGRSFIPVKSRYAGISLLEQMESTHDLMKELIDFSMDSGKVATSPFFFYRAAGSIKPEVIKLAAGEGYPVANPQQDVFFPTIQNQAAAFGINLYTLFEQMQQKNTMVGELQYGRVPQGKASALRTTTGMETVMGMGEARPERILRRFFMLLVEVWVIIHMLNSSFLPDKKKFRITGYKTDQKDAYEVQSPEDIAGSFQFDFKANMFNTQKLVLQQVLTEMMATFINPLFIQLGMTNSDTIFRLSVDWAKAKGMDATDYINPPTGSSLQPKLMAEEAISHILNGDFPPGIPEEPLEMHIQKVLAFQQDEEHFGMLTPLGVEIYRAYLQQLQVMWQQQQQLMMAMNSAGQLSEQMKGQGQGGSSGGGGGPVGGGVPPISGPNELIPEDLPGSGGGQNGRE